MNKPSGIIPPIPTPLNADETIDEISLRKMIKYCKEKNFGGVFVCGTNGEGALLTDIERLKAFEISLDEANGEIPILAGCMETASEKVCALGTAFEKMGGEYIVVTAPFYTTNKSETEIVNHIKKISTNVNLKTYVYNIPPYVGYEIPLSVVKEVSTFENVIGYKDSSGNIDNFIHLLQYFKDTEFQLFQGKATQVGLCLCLGADGAIPNISTLLPQAVNKLVYHSKLNELDEAIKYQQKINILLSALFKMPNIISGCKYLHSKLGLMQEHVCAPAVMLTQDEKKMLDEAFAQAGGII